MPAEIRHVMFSDLEVVGAIKRLYMRLGEKLPPGNPIRMRFSDEGGGRVDLELATEDGQSSRLIVERDKLSAALVMFCKEKGIPLPAAATKIIKVFDGKVTFAITL